MRSERNWEPWETAYLIQNAHRIPLEEICARLGRSADSVKAKAKRLRSYGKDVGQLRRCGAVPAQCPRCGEWRYLHAPGGVCRICTEEGRLEAVEGEISTLLPRLPAGSKRGRTVYGARAASEPAGSGAAWEEAAAAEIARKVHSRRKTLRRMKRDLGL